VKASVLAAPAVTVSGAEPAFPLASVAVMVVTSATAPLAFTLRVPALNALEVSPKVPSALLSNITLPVEELRVTTVELSLVTVLAN